MATYESYRDLLFGQFTGSIVYDPVDSGWESRGGQPSGWSPSRPYAHQTTEGIAGVGYQYGPSIALRSTNANWQGAGAAADASGWFKMSSEVTTLDQATLWRGDHASLSNYSLRISKDGIEWSVNSTRYPYDIALNDDKWHHWAVTRSGIWIDGLKLHSHNVSTWYSGNNSTVRNFVVGGEHWSSVNTSHPLRHFLTLDEIAVYPSSNLEEEMIIEQAAFFTPVEQDIETDATIADATAEMLMPGVEGEIVSPHVDLAADPFLAEASMPMPETSSDALFSVSAGAEAEMSMPNAEALSAINLRMLAPNAWDITSGPRGVSRNNAERFLSGSYQDRVLAIEVPQPSLPEDEAVAATTLTLNRHNTFFGNIVTVTFHKATRVDGAFVVGEQFDSATFSNVPSSVTTHEILVPRDTQYIVMDAGMPTENATVHRFDNPANDIGEYTNSFFTVQVFKSFVVDINPEPMVVTAEMMTPETHLQSGVHIDAIAALAAAEMLNGVFPDANTSANVMDVTAVMGSAWFKSDRSIAVDAFGASAGMLNVESVGVVSNIDINAPVALMTDGEIIDPEEVDNTTSDPYWNRVTGRRDIGQNPPSRGGGVWMRFNERRGDPYSTDTASGARKANPQGELTGAYRWGATAPNGKRGLRVDNAGLHDSRDDRWPGGTGNSYEFTIKVAPGHTGRMDILNGHMRQYGMGVTTHHRSHVSIRDGRIYVESKKYGTSISRIDDNKWHHIVLTPRPLAKPLQSHQSNQWPLDIYIDGKLDRTLVANENQWHLGHGDPRAMVHPDNYFGQDTGFPFRGEIVDFVFRWSMLNSNQVMELFLDMFGNEAVRPGVADATADIRGGKVESNMKRMLVLSFGNHGLNDWAGNGSIKNQGSILARLTAGIFVNEAHPVAYTPVMEHGFGKGTDIGNYRMSYQSVSGGSIGFFSPYVGTVHETVSPSVERLGHSGAFRDSRTGLPRLINLQEDVNLDDFDVIFVQAYPNPRLDDQATRQRYEDFLNSLNQALVDGHKLWITDPYLAHDLGWTDDADIVPVLPGRGNDVRATDVVPHPEMHGISQQPYPRPADGSKPRLPTGLPMGSTWGPQNVWDGDMHHNNGYRVVNEIDGLTTLPSWEVEEHFVRDQLMMFPAGLREIRQEGHKLVNRSGEDYEWTYTDPKTNQVHKMSKPSARQGLKAGDEFYDWTWTRDALDSNRWGTGVGAMRRTPSTWALPPGALKIGTPIATFRSTLHDDFGREVPNPYRNHIRNAVVRPGDTLPDGRKVKGYVYMDFAMWPEIKALAGHNLKKQLTAPPGVQPPTAEAAAETEQSFAWDNFILGRSTESSRGAIDTSYFRVTGKPGGGTTYSQVRVQWPAATFAHDIFPVDYVPHIGWQSRGLAWLLTVDKVDTEFATYSPQAATATAGMGTVRVGTEFETEVNVGPATAVANIMAPAEAQVRSASVMAWAATATGLMTGLVGGYSAEPAQVFASMPENVLRPQDIEEVLFFTLTMSQETITLRMEEN